MDNALAHGIKQLEDQSYKAAHASALELIRNNVSNPVPYYLLGRIALEHKNYAKADELLHKAQSLSPEDAFYLAAYAQYLITVGQQNKALEYADLAAALPIDSAHTADTVGVVYSRTGFHEKAVPMFMRAVKMDPKPANFHYNLGASQQFSGDFTGAKSSYGATIEREPDSFRAYSAIVGLSRQTANHNYLEILKRLFERLKADPDAALHIGHAIAKTLEDLGQHETSFDWLVEAKKAKRKQLGYSVRKDLDLFTAAKPTTGMRVRPQPGFAQEAPVFIVGLPRTGTTLVDRILSSHPDVQSAGELNTFAGLVKAGAQTPSNQVLDVASLQHSGNVDLAALGHAYINDTQRLTRGAARFTDKMPLNFFYVGLIHRALPNAKVIVLRRDPLDSILSNFRQLFSTGFSYYNYALDINDTASYYTAFDKLIAHWKQHVPATNLMEVQYEDIVHKQEETTAAMLSFCNLDWNDACMRFHENEAPVSTASSVQVRQPLYSGSIGRWKKYGDRLDSLWEMLNKQS